MKAYVHTKSERRDSTFDSYLTVEVPVKETETLPGKGQTQSGYGSQLPTRFMVKYNNRWQRVKCICFSNSGTLFIGNEYSPLLTVDIER